VLAGGGRNVSGRLASELRFGEDGGGEDDGEDVCTEMDVWMGSGIDVEYCWLEWRDLCLG
jgi:hypothetical protein